MPHSKKYIEYLKSKKWKERRYAALERANFRCQFDKCGEKSYLSVHHKTYERLGNEEPSDLIVLCSGHHWYADEVRKNQNIEEFRKETRLNLCPIGQHIRHKISERLKFKKHHGYLNKKSRKGIKKLKLELG